MGRNALEKGEKECAAIASEVLKSRFPVTTKRGGGATPTTARFLKEARKFDSGKEAYLWLIAKFAEYRSDVLDRYVALHHGADSYSKGCRFARNRLDLFPEGSKRRGNTAHSAKLEGGWFADTNLSHDDKFVTLIQLSYVCDLEYAEHWEFRVTGATDNCETTKR